MNARGPHLGLLALLATALLWGSNYVVARAVSETVPLPSVVFWRWFVAATLLTPLAMPGIRRSVPFLRANLVEIIVNATLGVGVFSYLLLGAAYNSLALEVGIINATTPLWVALLGIAVGQLVLGPKAIAAVAITFAGTLLILLKGDPTAMAAFRFGAGNLMALLAAISFAWFSLRVRAWSREMDALTITVVTAWIGLSTVMLPSYVIWVMGGGPSIAWNDRDVMPSLAAMAYIALGPTMLGNLFYLFGVSRVGPTRAATFLYLSPVASVALSIGLLGETLEWFHALGFAIIILGLMMIAGAGPEQRRT